MNCHFKNLKNQIFSHAETIYSRNWDRLRLFVLIFYLIAACYFILAVIGGFVSYTPVPLWDMWRGFVENYIEFSSGKWWAWWDQYFEHRIVLARFFFWIDKVCFKGSFIFLISINYVLAGLSFYVFNLFLREILKSVQSFSKDLSTIQTCIRLTIFCLVFSWMQAQNFTSAFQCQFFLAYVLPLCAFFLLYKSYEEASFEKYFFACLLGVFSLGSMGNGIFTLPLMTFLALFLRMNWKQILFLLFLTILGLSIYFYQYSFLGPLIPPNFLKAFEFFVLFLGSPFAKIPNFFANCLTDLWIPLIGGAFVLSSSFYFILKALKTMRQSSVQITLVMFILYCWSAGVAATATRSCFGMSTSLTSRYTTPSLMILISLLILFAPKIAKTFSEKRKQLWQLLALSIPLFCFLPSQFQSFTCWDLYSREKNEDVFFERQLGALSLNLNINDISQTDPILFLYRELLSSTLEKARKKNISIFGSSIFKDARSVFFNKISIQKDLPLGIGALEKQTSVDKDARFIKISGWLFDPKSHSIPKAIRILDTDSRVVGYALTGNPRQDLKCKIGKKAFNSGFKGYVLSEQIGKKVLLVGITPDCQISTFVPEF